MPAWDWDKALERLNRDNHQEMMRALGILQADNKTASWYARKTLYIAFFTLIVALAALIVPFFT